MTTVVVAHKPELTAEDTVAVFSRHFAGRYEVHHRRTPGSFVLRKSWWAQLNVSLVQREDSTSFTFSRHIPMVFFALVLLGFWNIAGLIVAGIGWLFVRRHWLVMEDEVTTLLLSASEFK